uniref:DUF2523 domain-containing protein n=1 Tax=Dulem virus 61 TaxID=3145772 RepID=A0AAU8B8T6_9VIRU
MAVPALAFAPFLLSMVASIVGRVLLALGFAVITFTGMDIAINQLKSLVSDGVSKLPSLVFDLFMLAGGGHSLNLLFSAISFRLAYWALTKSTRILAKK